MAAPTTPTALERIGDVIEYALKYINHDNGYRTNGILVDRDKDPRLVRDSQPESYNRHNAAITIPRTKRKLDRAKSVGGRHVWDCEMALMCLRTLTQVEDNDGKTLDNLAADLQDDVRLAFTKVGKPPTDNPLSLRTICQTLNIDEPILVGLSIDEVLEDTGANFPDSQFIIQCYFRMEERF